MLQCSLQILNCMTRKLLSANLSAIVGCLVTGIPAHEEALGVSDLPVLGTSPRRQLPHI